jgi:hypothetical protein
MNSGFVFGAGAFTCLLASSEALHLAHNTNVGLNLPGLVTFLVFGVMGCLFYAFGVMAFKRSVKPLVAFVLGIVAMLIQEAFIAAFKAHTDLDLSQNGLLNASFAGLLGAVAQLTLPLIVCAFLAPLLGRRANYSLKR